VDEDVDDVSDLVLGNTRIPHMRLNEPRYKKGKRDFKMGGTRVLRILGV
jgi:hypothetical protein